MRIEEKVIVYVLTWDWKSTPNWDEVEEAVKGISTQFEPVFHDFDKATTELYNVNETGKDKHCVIIASKDLTMKEQKYYFNLRHE